MIKAMDYQNLSETAAKCVLCLCDTDQIVNNSRDDLTKISDIYIKYLKPYFSTTAGSVSFDWDILSNNDEFLSSDFCVDCFTSGEKLFSMNERLKSIELEIENFVQTISTKILKYRSGDSHSYISSISSTDVLPSVSSGSISNRKVVKKWTKSKKTKTRNLNVKDEICSSDKAISSHSNDSNSFDDADFSNECNSESELDNDPQSLSVIEVEENSKDIIINQVTIRKHIVFPEPLQPDLLNHQSELLQPRLASPGKQSLGKRRKISSSVFFEEEKDSCRDSDTPDYDNANDVYYEPDPKSEDDLQRKQLKKIQKEENENPGKYECMHCEETFVCRRKYNSHIQTDHTDVANNCTKCTKTFVNKETLQQHIDYFHYIRAVPCKDCTALPEFSNLYDYEIHHMIHTGEIPYECQQCHEKFSNYSTYCDHRKWCATSNEVFSCEKCDNVFNAKCFLLSHINVSHPESKHRNGGKMSCHICENHVKFKDLISLETHYSAGHTKEFLYLCDICGDSFQSRPVFKRHRDTHLNDANINKCQLCDYSTPNYNGLQDHIKLYHTAKAGDILHSCVTCVKAFPSLEIYQTHLSTCGNSFPCDMCDTVCNSKKSFKEHVKIHREGKPICSICGKELKTHSKLKAHMKAQHSVKHICDTCGNTFNKKDDYVEHMRSHTESKSYECNLCGGIYNTVFKLKEHRRFVHLAQTILCKFCPQSFLTYSRKRLHEDTEHADRK